MARDDRFSAKRLARASVFFSGLAIGGCASTPPAPGELIADPYIETNRAIHSFNKGADTYVLRPVSQAYGFVTPALFQHMIGNGVDHLKLPNIFINRALQGDLEEAGAALARFTINTIMGAGGLLDPATEMGLPYTPTDFGVTLAKWGADEGVYLEAPLLGPHTTRHLVGRVFDVVLDPTILITIGVIDVSGVVEAVSIASIPLDVVNTRYENRELIDEVLYNTEDSYLTVRTGYIQNRRREVSGGTTTDQLPDIFQ